MQVANLRNMIKADGRFIPNPSNYNPVPNLREDSSENSLGDVKRKIISCRWKIEQDWDYLSKEDYSYITTLKFKKSFPCEFPATTGRRVKKTMYVGDLSGQPVDIDSNGIPTGWKEVKANFIQLKADKYTGGAY